MAIGQGPIGEAQGFGASLARKTVAFTGGAGAGQAGTAVPLFTVTGGVIALTIAVCTETLVGATSTVEVGTTANPATIIAQTGGPTITVGMIWTDNTPTVLECWTTGFGCMIGDGADIELMPRTANVTDGTLIFTCFWTPLTADGNVVPA
jgi:hypothetical protein